MAKAAVTDRKTRILDAAENAFADFGFDGASLRHIVLDAGVNLATVYYYFGSKEGLMAAVLERRFGPLRQEHLELLRQFEREALGQPVAVEKILEAILLPPLRLAETSPAKSQAVSRLIGRIVSEPNPQTQGLVHRQYDELRMAFLAAFQRSLPHLPLADLRWRMEFVWGALAFVLCHPQELVKEPGAVCNLADLKQVSSHMLAFFSAGFRAPAAT